MRIGETLLKANIITQEQLNIALKEQEQNHHRLGDIILKMGFTSPKDIAPILAEYFHIPFINLKELYKNIKPEIIDLVPKEIAYRFTIIPLDLKNNHTLVVAMFDPLDLVAIDTLRIKTGYKIEQTMAVESDIIDAIDYCYNYLPRLSEYVDDFIDLDTPVVENLDDQNSEAFQAGDQPVVQYVKSLIIQAINSHASDIHLKPKQERVDLRLRVDGVLHPIDAPPKAMLPAITTRIKILAGLDIAERRLPQDGRFKINVGRSEVDLRVSSFPTIYGESIVMRLLDTSAPLQTLDSLGLEGNALKEYRNLINRPYGLILVTGPTGSGKTTTLYTTLNEIKTEAKNIITLEDPVEYRLPFIQQTQINSAIGLSFARGLRSILRQDPDIILVGEIRDKETAEIAINAALTGHLVFSTLHTNDASGAAIRLINMGIEPFLITSSLLCVIAQRLVRTICPSCKTPVENPHFGHIYQAKGCEKCLNSGYRGRIGIYETLIPDDALRQLILKQSSGEEILNHAKSIGMKTLYESGLEKIREGLTTPQELMRAIQDNSK